MKKIWVNRKYIIKKATYTTSFVLSGMGLMGTFIPWSDLLPNTLSFWIRLLISVGILVGLWLTFAICHARRFDKEKCLEIFEAENGCHVYVQYGDVLSSDILQSEDKKRNIVIPVNRCFDTLVNNDLISARTLHGVVFNRLYESGKYNEYTMNEAIQNNLKMQRIVPEIISHDDKRAGNLKRYPVGTIAEIESSDECVYFLLGLSTFNYNLKAETSSEEYVIAMMKLVEYCYERSQQYPVVIPLIGAGLSRANRDERAILEYMVKLLKLNKELIKSDIYIVVRDSGENTIPITEL